MRRDDPEDNSLSDVITGNVYKTLRQRGTISNSHISIQWNADGVQTFKSSKVSMCPIQVSVNELPYRSRKENILLAGLWASKTRPMLEIFLKPFIDELTDLYNNGFECFPPNNHNDGIVIKVCTILSPVDSVERCALQNIHQYNGDSGCSFCLHPGERIPFGKGYTRVYRGGDKRAPRTIVQHEQDATRAEAENTAINGVKGFSPVMLLPVFHIIRSFPPDYMHCVLLGVVKLVLSTWTKSTESQKPWYIGTKTKMIDARLKNLLPPSEITRVPQSLYNLTMWKASEFKNFLLYYFLICLKNILRGVYYKHWLLFVYAIHIFCSDKIEPRDFKKASKALKKFVEDIESLYGRELMKYNVHLLLHVPQSVQDFRALWGWSTFPYESYNFILKNMLNGSQAVLQQICTSYLRYQSIKYVDVFTRPNCNEVGKELFFNMLKKYRGKTGRRTLGNDQLIVYGNKRSGSLTVRERLTVEALLRDNVHADIFFYDRFLFNDVLYHSSQYKKMYKRNNSVVETTNRTFIEILKNACVRTVQQKENYVIIGKLFKVIENDTLCTVADVSSSRFSYSVRLTENLVSIFPENIRKKCVFMSLLDKSYIFPLVNNIETE